MKKYSIEDENWKPIKGYENSYLISNYGRVFSMKSNIVLKQQKHSSGYKTVALSKNGKLKSQYIHRLVMKSFKPNGEKETVNHIDGDKCNNHVSNLEWSSYKENNIHAIKTGLITTEHRRNHKGSIPVKQFSVNGEFIKTYPSMREAERQTGIDCRSISLGIKKGWHYGGYKWEYA